MGEVIGRLLMLLTGFFLVMLGFITAMHSDHQVLGILLSFGGVMTMFEGLPRHE